MQSKNASGAHFARVGLHVGYFDQQPLITWLWCSKFSTAVYGGVQLYTALLVIFTAFVGRYTRYYIVCE